MYIYYLLVIEALKPMRDNFQNYEVQNKQQQFKVMESKQDVGCLSYVAISHCKYSCNG